MKTLVQGICLLLSLAVATRAEEEHRTVVRNVVRCAGYEVVATGRQAKRIQVHKPFELVDAPSRDEAGAPGKTRIRAARNKRAVHRGPDPDSARRWARFYRQQRRSRQPEKSTDSFAELLGASSERSDTTPTANWGWLSREAGRHANRQPLATDVPAGLGVDTYPWLPSPAAPLELPRREEVKALPQSAWPNPLRQGGTPLSDDLNTGLWKSGKR